MKYVLIILLTCVSLNFASIPKLFLLESPSSIGLSSAPESLVQLFEKPVVQYALEYDGNNLNYGNVAFSTPLHNNTSFQIKLNNMSLMFDTTTSLYKMSSGIIKKDGGFLLLLAGVGYFSHNSKYNALSYGYGYKIQVMKSLKNTQLGLSYDSGTKLNWNQNSDFLLLNYVPPVFGVGLKYIIKKEKKHFDFYLNLDYQFEWLRFSGATTRNYMLYPGFLQPSAGMSFYMNTQQDNYIFHFGVMNRPEASLSELNTDDYVVFLSTGLDYKTTKISWPIIFSFGYMQNINNLQDRNLKAGVSYEF